MSFNFFFFLQSGKSVVVYNAKVMLYFNTTNYFASFFARIVIFFRGRVKFCITHALLYCNI